MNALIPFQLDGKLAIVTGGTGLYGAPFSRALAEAGAHVVITSRRLSEARRVADELRAQGLRAEGRVLDQSDPESIAAFRDDVLDEHGRVDVLVNNAVLRAGAGLHETTAEDWEATSAVNSRGLFLLTQAIVASMEERGSGSIVNIASIYGLVAPDFPVYASTSITSPIFYAYDKAGMIGLTRYLASALGPHGIRVNCIAPGGLRTDETDPVFEQAYAARVPLGRMADADDVTGALIFLASEASRYVTGVTLAVDGGWTAR